MMRPKKNPRAGLAAGSGEELKQHLHIQFELNSPKGQEIFDMAKEPGHIRTCVRKRPVASIGTLKTTTISPLSLAGHHCDEQTKLATANQNQTVRLEPRTSEFPGAFASGLFLPALPPVLAFRAQNPSRIQTNDR
jgi:hypothetical protein